MDLILIPGLWLDASSWDEVVPHLEKLGHEVHPLTLPGMESRDADRSGVTRAGHVAAVVAAIDSVDGPVALVGHSMGAGLAHAAVDARPDRVARAVYIGGFPDADRSSSEFPSAGGEISLFDWDDFDEADVRDLDTRARARFRARAIPAPARAVNDPQRLSDERRYQVPVIMICPESAPRCSGSGSTTISSRCASSGRSATSRMSIWTRATGPAHRSRKAGESHHRGHRSGGMTAP